MIRRLEAPAVGLVLEWDSETGESGLSMLSGGPGGRDRAYGQVDALWRFLRPLEGFWWDDLRLSEHYRTVCGQPGMALVWRARFTPPASVRVLVRAVAAALGVTEDELRELER